MSDRARRRLGLERVELDDEDLRRIEELADLAPIRERLEKALAELSKVVVSNVDVLLAKRAATALSAVFGLPELTGADLGDATVKIKA